MTRSEYQQMHKLYLGGEYGDGRKLTPLVNKGWLEGNVYTGWNFTKLGRRYFVSEQRRRMYGREGESK